PKRDSIYQNAHVYTSGVRVVADRSIFWRRSAKYAVSSSADFTLPREHDLVEQPFFSPSPVSVPHEEHPPPSDPQPGLPHPSVVGFKSLATGVWDRSSRRTERPNRAERLANSGVASHESHARPC